MIDNPTGVPRSGTGGVPRQFDERRSQPVVRGSDLRRVRHHCRMRRIRCSTSGSHQPHQPGKRTNIHGIEMAFQHFFGESGFGLAGNYTVVDGDVACQQRRRSRCQSIRTGWIERYRERQRSSTRSSGSRPVLAWNWRDEFLYRRQPWRIHESDLTTDAYRQWDLNVSYDVSEALASQPRSRQPHG